MKRDLGLTDAQIGFLYGTAFAVFYAVFGIPFGRLGDAWSPQEPDRHRALLLEPDDCPDRHCPEPMLGTYRVGVGVGEASLSPSAYSLIVDYFPQRLRATALALYSGGIYLGAATGFALGGWIVDFWSGRYPEGSAPLGLAAWQAAFLAVGIPGLIMALWVWTCESPPRASRRELRSKPWVVRSRSRSSGPSYHPSPSSVCGDPGVTGRGC